MLVEKLVIEKETDILILILQLLCILLEGDMATPYILNTPVLTRLIKHLSSNEWRIRQLAAETLGSISFNDDGKRQTIEAGAITPLCEMLSDAISDVRTSSVRALASLA